MRNLVFLAAMVTTAGTAALAADESVVLEASFDDQPLGEPPPGWIAFHESSRPRVRVAAPGANGSARALRAERSDSGGWTSLSRRFEMPQQRVMIEFRFAFSPGRGRTLNVWTHEPGGSDASQFNLCIQNNALQQFDGRTRSWVTITRAIEPSSDPQRPVWHRLRALVDAHDEGIDYWVSPPNSEEYPTAPVTCAAYRPHLEVGAIDVVSGQRVAEGGWYLIDDLVITAGESLPRPHALPPLEETVALWTGPEIPADTSLIPFAAGIRHQTIHRALENEYQFLHGAAIIHEHEQLFAHWANSPVHENGPHETLRGRRSSNDGRSWTDVEVIGAGFDGPERHSHGVFLRHQGELWSIGARFGLGTNGRRFPGLLAEGFVWDEATAEWRTRGIVMENCWPYDEPVLMANGRYITGGQDRNGWPVIAISEPNDPSNWETISIEFDLRLQPAYAETTVWADDAEVVAIIRGGGGVAWIARSDDFGRSWSTAAPTNFPMPRAKAYLTRLTTGQLCLVSNLYDRNTLVVSVSAPGADTLHRMWRIRGEPAPPPRFTGRAKSSQWSYPYAHEHDGRLYVVYSIGKEDCGLSIVPIASLQP